MRVRMELTRYSVRTRYSLPTFLKLRGFTLSFLLRQCKACDAIPVGNVLMMSVGFSCFFFFYDEFMMNSNVTRGNVTSSTSRFLSVP